VDPPRLLARTLPLCAAAALLAGCAPPVWNPESLEAREPRLRALGSHRLGDATPYLLPVQDALVLFLCRWETRDPIPVSLPPEASPEQAGALEAGLRAWEAAGLGVRFARGAPAGTGIELRFVAEQAEGAGAARGATTVADCALDPQAATRGDRLAARLVFASIHLRVDMADPIGQRVPVSAADLAGAALHELGHALGFQGHVRSGESAMRYQVDAIRRVGRRLLAGEAFHDETLRALYSVPSGIVVGRSRLPPGRTQPVDRLLAMARAGSLAGPIARMGDLEGQILFRDSEGAAYTIWLRGVAGALAGRPEDLLLMPGPRAQRRLSVLSHPGGTRARARPLPLPPVPARATPRRVGTG
jgi:hypothetical protein